MMEISKNELLEKDLKIEAINLSEMLKELVNRQSYLIDDKNLKLIYKVENKLYIKADREKIIKVLNNLINNAIKYSPKGEKRGKEREKEKEKERKIEWINRFKDGIIKFAGD